MLDFSLYANSIQYDAVVLVNCTVSNASFHIKKHAVKLSPSDLWYEYDILTFIFQELYSLYNNEKKENEKDCVVLTICIINYLCLGNETLYSSFIWILFYVFEYMTHSCWRRLVYQVLLLNNKIVQLLKVSRVW